MARDKLWPVEVFMPSLLGSVYSTVRTAHDSPQAKELSKDRSENQNKTVSNNQSKPPEPGINSLED